MKRGFTLIELLVAITVLAVIFAIAAPMMSDDTSLRMRATSGILMSDIEYAQVSSISFPNDPIAIRFNPADAQYWLADADTPDTPMTRPDTGEPYLVTLGEGRASSALGLTLAVENMTDNTITFNEQGGLTQLGASPTIMLGSVHDSIDLVLRIEIDPTTGSLAESFGSADDE